MSDGKKLSSHTRRAYDADWRSFSHWCDAAGIDPLCATYDQIARYLESRTARNQPRSLAPATLERNLAAIGWRYREHNIAFERQAEVLISAVAKIRGSLPRREQNRMPLRADDLIGMVSSLDLRRLAHIRGKAILLLAFAAGLKGPQIAGLDMGPGQSPGDRQCTGWIEMLPDGVGLRLQGKGGRKLDIHIPRTRSDLICPVASLGAWIHLGGIETGPVFRTLAGGRPSPKRLGSAHVSVSLKRMAKLSGLDHQAVSSRALALGGQMTFGEKARSVPIRAPKT